MENYCIISYNCKNKDLKHNYLLNCCSILYTANDMRIIVIPIASEALLAVQKIALKFLPLNEWTKAVTYKRAIS